jgi:hypothetical protein
VQGQQRSKGGCWTCKLRKKKCDEVHPSCTLCLSLGIDCHGYGSKPSWMDGGSAEREKLECWRQKVKELTNQKRKLKGRQNASRALPIQDTREEGFISATSKSSAYTNLSPQSLPSLNDVHTDVAEEQTSRDPLNLCEDEKAALLMYYLDYVFPIQFPFYQHSPINGGRGWALALLMQLEPLYHAALSAACYHMHFEEYTHWYERENGGLHDTQEYPACPRLGSQLTEYNLTLSRISKLLDGTLERNQSEARLSEYVELIACTATLISHEASYSLPHTSNLPITVGFILVI